MHINNPYYSYMAKIDSMIKKQKEITLINTLKNRHKMKIIYCITHEIITLSVTLMPICKL